MLKQYDPAYLGPRLYPCSGCPGSRPLKKDGTVRQHERRTDGSGGSLFSGETEPCPGSGRLPLARPDGDAR